MKILYASGSYVPSRRASSVHVMRMCAALSRQAHDVTLVTKRTPSRQERGVDDAHAFYGVTPAFALRPIFHPGVRGGGRVWMVLVRRTIARERNATDLVYARDLAAAAAAAELGLPVLYEAHGPPVGRRGTNQLEALLANPCCRRLVVISEALADIFDRAGWRSASGDTVVAHDGADAGLVPESAPSDRLRLGYVGHLYPGRGVELLAALADRLPECDLHLIGGAERELATWRARALPANMLLHGFVPPGEVPDRLRDVDVLLMPYQRRVGVASGRSDTAAWMSPMKMFESMASGRPIVASDLPVLREVLRDGVNALLVDPENVEAWVGAVRRLARNGELARELAAAARCDLELHYTWDARAARVLDGL